MTIGGISTAGWSVREWERRLAEYQAGAPAAPASRYAAPAATNSTYSVIVEPVDARAHDQAVTIVEEAARQLGISAPGVNWFREISPREADELRNRGETVHQDHTEKWGYVWGRGGNVHLNVVLPFNSPALIDTCFHEVYHLAYPNAAEDAAKQFGNIASATAERVGYYDAVRKGPADRQYNGLEPIPGLAWDGAYRDRQGNVIWPWPKRA